MSVTWPDLVIGAFALFFTLKGFKRGIVRELAGMIALGGAIVAAVRYPGTLDDLLVTYLHASPGAAHIAGMVVFALAVYLAIAMAAWIVERFARLPIVSFGNSLAGAAVGLLKALVAAWAVLYVALFLPLPYAVRADLHRSTIVSLVTQPNARVDAFMRSALPAFAKPVADPVFLHHRV